MKFSMPGQEKGDPFNTGDCLMEVTTWAGLIAFVSEGVSAVLYNICMFKDLLHINYKFNSQRLICSKEF